MCLHLKSLHYNCRYWVTTCAPNDRNQVFLLFNSFGGTADPSAQQFNIPACQGHPNQAPAPLSSAPSALS